MRTVPCVAQELMHQQQEILHAPHAQLANIIQQLVIRHAYNVPREHIKIHQD